MSGAFGCLLLGEECEATRLGDAAQVRGKEAAGERSNSRRLAGQSLVHWVLRRASEAQQLRGLVVSARPEHASAAFQQALPGNVCLHVSDAPDAWTRLLDCQQWLEKQRREAVTGFVQLRRLPLRRSLPARSPRDLGRPRSAGRLRHLSFRP